MRHSRVARYLGQIRRRALLVFLARAVPASLATFALLFVGAAAAAGPTVEWPFAIFTWALASVAALAVGVALSKPVRGISGARAARLIARLSPELASSVRSVLELGFDTSAQALSPALVDAHRAQVERSIGSFPAHRVVPAKEARHPALFIGVLLVAIAAVMVASFDQVQTGAFALLHPAAEENGLRVGAVVRDFTAKLHYPAYLERPSVTVENPSLIEAPRGTTVRVRLTTRIAAEGGTLVLPEGEVRLSPRVDGGLEAQFVVREGGALETRIRTADGSTLRDSAQRSLRVVADKAPRVVMTEPKSDRTLALHQAVLVSWDARDDAGIRSVDLVVQTADGVEHRRRLTHFDASQRTASGLTELVPSEYAVEPGDRLRVWVEAMDGDDVSGPNVGASERRTLTIESEAMQRAETLDDIRSVVGYGLTALADRLELAVPEAEDEARERFGTVEASTTMFIEGLTNLSALLSGGPSAGPSDPSVYRGVAQKLRRALKREQRLHGRRLASLETRVKRDAGQVELLENATLLIADMLGRAQLDDAASLTRELEDLRRQMASLLSELRRTHDLEARKALLRTIARAEARMRELLSRIAAMGRDVPSDFINTEAMSSAESKNALDELRRAVERGDLESASEHLLALEQHITSLAKALGSGTEAFAEARFGERDRAMAEAMDRLTGLEAEQRGLARRSGELRRSAAELALESNGGKGSESAKKLLEQAEEASKGLGEVPSRGLGAIDREAMDRARQRVRDAADALRTGDLGEALRMAEAAETEMEDLARDLRLSSLMFPGAEGEMSEASRSARRAERRVEALRSNIDQAIPNVERFIDAAGRKQMRQDQRRQHEAARVAGELAERFERGPDGAPLSPDAADAIRRAQESMHEAREALEKSDPLDAARAQEEAARRLAELREQLEQQKSQGSGGGGRGESGQASQAFRQPVRIPGADEHQGPIEQRRQLLDAMKEGAPKGFEESVRRYYEELLR